MEVKYMKGRISTEYGDVIINSDVIATYAGSVAVGCFGIVGMAAISMKDGLVHLLKKDSLKYGINVKIEDNKISLVLHCIVSYGVNLLAMSDNLEESVRYKLEQFTGMTVEHIDILIDGIRVID